MALINILFRPDDDAVAWPLESVRPANPDEEATNG